MKKNRVLKHLLVGLMFSFTFLLFIACSSGDSNNDAATTEGEAVSSPEASNLGIGDSATVDDVTITLLAMSESAGSEYNMPQDGNVFVLLEFLFENNGSKEVTITSLGNFDAYVDTYAVGTSFEGLYEAGSDKTLDKAVAPGKKLQGFIAYEVSTDWQELEVNVAPDFSSSESVQFIITK